MDCKSIGERIKARKQALGITANDLVERSGVPLDTINNIVYGRISNPSIDSIGKISIALETTIDYLVFGNCPNPQVEEKHHKDHHCCFDAERYIQSMIDVHKREMEAQCKAKDELIEELRKSQNFWRKLCCIFMAFLGAILVWFTWDILHPDQGLIRRLQSLGVFGRNIG
jgi:transcriptional regulator with XRE-family HTH domain